MATKHGKSGTILVGSFDLSQYFRRWTVTQQNALVEQTGFTDSARNFIDGLRSGSLSISGMWDPAAGASDVRLDAELRSTSNSVVTVSSDDSTAGNACFLFGGKVPSVNIENSFEDLISVKAEWQSDTDYPLGGVWIHKLQTETTLTAGPSVDGGAASTNGGRANLHVTAFSGTSAGVDVEDSADNFTFASLLSFTSVTGVTSESKAITGTIRRYTRHATSGTFTSITFAESIGRK